MYAAVDIGGTKTLVAAFGTDGKIVEQAKFPTPQAYQDFLTELAATVEKLSTNDFRRGVVAAPGLLDRKHGIGKVFGNLPWTDVPLAQDCEKIFKCPIWIENDAKLAALSEATVLKNEFKKVLYITVSTGISGGVVINGHLAQDFLDIEPGHMTLEHKGRFELWEEFASGRAIFAKYQKKAEEITDEMAWYEIARNLAVGLNTLIATLDPEVIVIGGGVGAHLEKFQMRLEEQLKIYETPMTPVPPIRKARHAEQAVILGCYELAKEQRGSTHSA